MALPKQVEQQIKEVEEIEKSMQVPPQAGDTSASQEPQEPQEPQEAVQPVNEEPPSDTAADATTEAQPDASEDWKAKYLTLQGKYSAEVPRLHQQNKELVAKLAELQESIDALKAKPQSEDKPSLITEKDEAEFGADLIELIRRAQKEAVEDATRAVIAERDALKAELDAIRARLDNTSSVVQYTTFEQQLHRVIPDFDQVNTDPKWIAWLDTVDRFTGMPRRVYAEAQYAKGNVAEIKRIVDLYKAEIGEANREQRQKELNLQVQPSKNAAGAVATQPQRRTYTEAEISKEFDRLRKLHIQGRTNEASALEAELTAAYVEGRVIG